HMGGIRVELDMSTDVPGLYAAGEAVGGANGANRLSGNAITEAITFGFEAGHSAADWAAKAQPVTAERARELATQTLALLQTPSNRPELNTAALIGRLQTLMQTDVGPFRTEEGLTRALRELAVLRDELGDGLPG